MTVPVPADRALGTALAAEHAAVYAYGVIAARTTGRLRTTATTAFNAHRGRRDRLRALIVERGGTPAEPQAAYELPVVPSGAAQAVELAVLVEQGVATAYLELAAADDDALRELAALAVQECVKRSYGLRPRIEAFPGMPEGSGAVAPSPSGSAGPGRDPQEGTAAPGRGTTPAS
ncbi:ferritin-like domain-containing protein [Planomonospora alba]|uniref:Ferritin-like domain-containing protein n=1 Tax=Planomonospora alba TaxID=161354 RepID=A0ABP6P0W0_9ACTN